MNKELTKNKKHQFNAENLKTIEILNKQKYKALILYLIPLQESPKQALFQLLKYMASNGYLCIVCDHMPENNNLNDIENVEHNLFLIHQGFSIIPVFKSLSAIILTTQDIHPAWNEILSNKYLWYHIDFASHQASSGASANIFEKIDLISYYEEDRKGNVLLSSNLKWLALKRGEETQNNMLLVEERLKSNPKGWQIFANLDLSDKVAVMTATFLDFEGEYFYSGGAERYLLDLAVICEELEKELVIFQYGNYPWVRRFKNIDVVSLSHGGLRAEGWIIQCAKAFNHAFYEQVQARTALNIYSAFYEAWPLAANPNIGISHGVAWDNPYYKFENAFEFWLMNERHIQGAKACEYLVSVDTNSANWLQTVDYDLGQKTKVIPNYVDLALFRPRDDYLEKQERTVILYPRQLYSARGLYLVLEIIEDILEKYPDVEFHFVGRGGEEDINKIIEIQKKWKARVKYYALSMDEMPKAYQNADISLIPSIHSEGTSLSCLEAMASGNAVIATRIGGLSDLIINNYNGLLIDPQAKELKQAIISLLEDQEQLTLLKKRSLEVAQSFTKTLWQERWKLVLVAKIKNEVRNQSYPAKRSKSIEIRLKDTVVDFGKLGELITQLLIEGSQVYIRSITIPDRLLSFSRVQWLGPDTLLFSPCDLIIEW